jgi:hypothetical protein
LIQDELINKFQPNSLHPKPPRLQDASPLLTYSSQKGSFVGDHQRSWELLSCDSARLCVVSEDILASSMVLVGC